MILSLSASRCSVASNFALRAAISSPGVFTWGRSPRSLARSFRSVWPFGEQFGVNTLNSSAGSILKPVVSRFATDSLPSAIAFDIVALLFPTRLAAWESVRNGRSFRSPKPFTRSLYPFAGSAGLKCVNRSFLAPPIRCPRVHINPRIVSPQGK
jgi:hypothetical protein